VDYRNEAACEYVHGSELSWDPIPAATLHSMALNNETFRDQYTLNYSLR